MGAQEELIKVFAAIDDNADMSSFFREIFTSKELNDLSLRWQLLKELYEGKPQRTISSKYKISLCKITRGSKILKKEHSITKRILDKYYGEEQ